MEQDIYWLKKKIEAGAEYAVTQMFYDNRKYFEFVERVRKEGINVPIIPGIQAFPQIIPAEHDTQDVQDRLAARTGKAKR